MDRPDHRDSRTEIALDQKAAATAAIVRRMVETCPDDTLAGLRDRALILVGFAGALRRSELVAIDVDHLTWIDDGARLLIPRSKTDQEGQGQVIALLRGTRLRPVAALRAWLAAAAITTGAVFRPVAVGLARGAAARQRGGGTQCRHTR